MHIGGATSGPATIWCRSSSGFALVRQHPLSLYEHYSIYVSGLLPLLGRDWLYSEQWTCPYWTPVKPKDGVHQVWPFMHIHWWLHVTDCKCFRNYIVYTQVIMSATSMKRSILETGDSDMTDLHTVFSIWWHAAITLLNEVLQQDGQRLCCNLMCTPGAHAMGGILLCQEMALWTAQLLQSICCLVAIPLSHPGNKLLWGDIRVWWQNYLMIFSTCFHHCTCFYNEWRGWSKIIKGNCAGLSFFTATRMPVKAWHNISCPRTWGEAFYPLW